jgi:hypothetical protein
VTAAAAGALCCVVASCGPRAVELGFWIEPVSFASQRIGAPISVEEFKMIEEVARAEIVHAFREFRATVTSNRAARYKVRVVQRLSDTRMVRQMDVAGESRAMRGFGGSGAVSLDFVANAAMVFSPSDADRSAVLQALGRGMGRVAVHEFAHQLLPNAVVDDNRDPNSYEHDTASHAQYFGDMHWGSSADALRERIAPRGSR